MKKALLFAIIALSINAFAQSRHPLSPSMGNVWGRMENTGIKAADITSPMNLGKTIKHQIPHPGTLIQIFDSIYDWQWDTISIGWKLNSKTLNIVYDARKNLTSYISKSWNGSAWVNSWQTMYTYDARNNQTSELDQNWNGSAWVNSWQTMYTYDAGNNQTNELYQDWNGSVWINSEQYIYTYDANNNKTSERDQRWSGGAWLNTWQYSYTYDVSNNMTIQLNQRWAGNDWENTMQYTYTYDINGNRISGLAKMWSTFNNTWVDNERITYTYDARNNLTKEFHEGWNGNTWENLQQWSYVYDADNNQTSELNQVWNGTSWVTWQQFRYTYDTNNFPKTFEEKDWNNPGTEIISGDSAYYYFHAVSGINDLLSKSSTVRIYPNPSSNFLTIDASRMPARYQLSITNLTGQELVSQQVTEPKTTIDISNLTSGVYFVRLTNGKTVEMGKFIKQ